MSWMKKGIACIAILLLTQSCAMYRLAELRSATQSGDAFQTALSKLYMDFATQEEKEYDWFNSWHFADKGLMLAYGKEVPPEALEDWNIPADALQDLTNARRMLMAVLTPENMHNLPTRTAEAQFYFDCWIEQQEENWQQDDIAFCREHMMNALEGLHGNDEKPVAKSATPTPKKVTKPVAQKPEKPAVVAEKKAAPEVKSEHTESVSYAVFFETNKAELSPPGKNVINEVIGSLKGASNYEVVLHASSDKSVVDALSSERSQVVKKRLMEGGVPESAIRRSDSPALKNASPSQRVEIFLNE